jgi:hypothetical protein
MTERLIAVAVPRFWSFVGFLTFALPQLAVAVMTEPLDDDYLLEHAREQQRRAANHHTAGGDRCTRCPHGWHGAICATAACGCATSWKAAS